MRRRGKPRLRPHGSRPLHDGHHRLRGARPAGRPPGIRVEPRNEVEGETYGDVATIVQVSFLPVFAGGTVVLNASELYWRCRRPPRLVWVTMGE